MASKLRYGWETGDEPAPTTSGTTETVGTHPRTGSKCGKVTGSGYYQWAGLGYVLDRDHWIRRFFYLDGSPAGLGRIVQILTGAGGVICNARLNAERKLQIYDSEGNQLGSPSSTLVMGGWHDLEIHVRVNTAGEGILGARLNGTELLPDQAANVGNTAIGRIRVGFEGSTIEAIYPDDVGVNDDQGEEDNTWQQALKPGDPVAAVNARRKRRLGFPWGLYNVNNSSIKANDHFEAIRFVPDEALTLYRFIMGFNLEGVAEGPNEIKGEAYGGKGRDKGKAGKGYGDGDGGIIHARLVSCNPDGTPNLSDVLAEEEINAVDRYEESHAEYGITAGKLTQLLFLSFGGVALKADQMYAVVIGNASPTPSEDWFSVNNPVVHEDEGGPHAENTTEKYPEPDQMPIAGLDPREACAWSRDGGEEWVWGAAVGGPDGLLPGYYDGIGAGEDGVRLPWYGYQQAEAGPIKAVQPYYAYEATGSYTLRCKNAALAKTVTHVGGYAKAGENLGVVTIHNLTTGEERSLDLTEAGSGIVYDELASSIDIGAGDSFTITNTGDVCLLQADSFIDKTFNTGDEAGEFPFTTDGEENNVAQLFALPWPYFKTASAPQNVPPRIAFMRESVPDRLALRVADPTTGATIARWARDEPSAENVLDGLKLSGELNGGAKEAACGLARNPRFSYPDLLPFLDVEVYGPGAETIWEGRLDKAPESDGDRKSIDPAIVGHRAALEDNKALIGPGFIDQRLSQFGEVPAQRRLDLEKAGIDSNAVSASVEPYGGGDAAAEPASLSFAYQALKEGVQERGEFVYDSGGPSIGEILYDFKGRSSGNDADFFNRVDLSQDGITTHVAGTDHESLTALQQSVKATVERCRYAIVTSAFQGAAVVADPWVETFRWQHPVVLGTHELPLQGEWPEVGLMAKQMLAWAIPQFTYLELDEEELEDDGFVIPQAWFAEPGSMLQVVEELTKYGLLDWFVRGKKFHLRFPGTYGRKWQAYAGPAGLKEQGLDASRLWRSIVVRYTDVDGSVRTVGPPGSGAMVEDAGLELTDPEHPAVQAAITRQDVLDLNGIGVQSQAIAVGERWLEQANLLSRSGSCTVTGYLLDDKGVLRPVSHIREGDLLRFPDAHDTSYRRIVSYEYTDEGRSNSLALDAPKESIPALLERFNAKLSALGIS